MKTSKIITSVLRQAWGDLSNNGISNREVSLLTVNPNNIGNKQDELERIHRLYGEFLVVVERKGYSTILKPYSIYSTGIKSMFGGNFAYSSSYDYENVTGMTTPIAIHDRLEA